MEREANYAAVGAFVVLVVVMAVMFVYWYSDAREHRDYTRYEVYFEGSVSGLERGASVRYLGVDIGRVLSMRIDSRDSSRVQVLVDIDSTAPVSAKTIAELSLQGVTGLLYMDLIQDTGTRRLSPAVPSEKYPVIRSARSSFDVLLATLPDLVGIASDVADRATRLLSDKNIASVSNALANIDKATATLPQTVHDIQTLVADLRGTANEIHAVARSANNVVGTAGPELITAMQRVRTVADNLSSASSRLDKLVEDNRQDVRSFTREGLPELERFLREGRSAAREFRDLSRSLKDDPSQLIYQPTQQGVEIPR
ncbi:MAG TPA: MlaD family protein [Steroidobacteraceae bacterium]|jgi:phospholipid/cholesterol/gamma-HCH transport system substrate-binding protein|nr:MlaD family protein [Steroidobacteraceae bacterium]